MFQLNKKISIFLRLSDHLFLKVSKKECKSQKKYLTGGPSGVDENRAIHRISGRTVILQRQAQVHHTKSRKSIMWEINKSIKIRIRGWKPLDIINKIKKQR